MLLSIPASVSDERAGSLGFLVVYPTTEEGTCTSGVYISPENRRRIRKETVFWCLDKPFELGFERCLTKTMLGKMITLFEMLSRRTRYVIVDLGLFNQERYFLYGKRSWA